MTTPIIIGIDCAASEKKIGLALGTIDQGKLTIRKARLASMSSLPLSQTCSLSLPMCWTR